MESNLIRILVVVLIAAIVIYAIWALVPLPYPISTILALIIGLVVLVYVVKLLGVSV